MTREVVIEYGFIYRNKVKCVFAYRKESGFNIGEFKSVDDMKEYCLKLYKLNRVKFERVYEKGGKEADA